MVVKQEITLNGKTYVKHYSDSNYYIQKDGINYISAIDIEDNDSYIETNEKILDCNDENGEDLTLKNTEDIEALKEQNELLVGCILEMADIIYA